MTELEQALAALDALEADVLVRFNAVRGHIRNAIDVENPPTPTLSYILITPPTFGVAEAGTVQLSATAYDQLGEVMEGVTFTWGSSDAGVASVNSSTGLVTGVSSGSCSITASASGGISSTPANCTVSPATVASVTVSPTSLSGTEGSGNTLTATVWDGAGGTGNVLTGRTVTWASDATGVATVTSPGQSTTVTYVAAGSANVTATCETVNSAAVGVTVNAASADHPNEPAGLTLITDRGFSAAIEDGWGSIASGLRTDWAGAPVSQPNYVRFTKGVGSGAGSFSPGSFGKTITGKTDIYFHTHFRTSSAFYGNAAGTKMGPFLVIDGNNPFLWFHTWGTASATIYARINIQGCPPNLGGNSSGGDANFGGNTIALTRGSTYGLEVYVRLNTFNTANGIIRAWMNGQLFVNKTNAAFIGSGTLPAATSASSKITELRMNAIWGGTVGTVGTTTQIDYDHYYASGA